MVGNIIDVTGLQALIEALHGRGYTVLGPTLRGGAIVTAPIAGVDDLPHGTGDAQEPGSYRLRERGDDGPRVRVRLRCPKCSSNPQFRRDRIDQALEGLYAPGRVHIASHPV